MDAQQQNIDRVIVGLGTTGLSVARYLAKHDCDFAVVDSRKEPPCADDLFELTGAQTTTHFGDFNTPLLNNAKQLIVNPGVAIATAEIDQAKKSGVEIVGDVELFCRDSKNKPVIAITGSNGKTTVTTLLDLMAKESGVNVGTGGNIGMPALDLLSNDDTNLFVLELSSYQLETTPSLQTLTAVILNISEDHLDRYNNDIEQYAKAKSLIYSNCDNIVFNREDDYSSHFANQSSADSVSISFGLNKPEQGHYGLQWQDDVEWLAKGDQLLMPVHEVKQVGRHNVANSLAALALGEIAGLKLSAMLTVLRTFAGMAHRTEWISKIKQVQFYNDSKGTNVGATLSALSGLSGKTVLIAGGQGKGADFLPLSSVIKEKARAVVLFGEDAKKIASIIDESVTLTFVSSMEEAVRNAYQLANKEEKDNVLLSPACASFDMFENYMARGLAFVDEVKKLETLINDNKSSETGGQYV